MLTGLHHHVSLVDKIRTKIMKGATTTAFSGMMLAATVFALWGADVYELINPPISNDRGIGATIFLCFILFFLEFFLMSFCKDGYPLSFFFWLDLVAALSLLPDVLGFFGIDALSGGGGSSIQVARAGRAARAGTRFEPTPEMTYADFTFFFPPL